MRTNVAYDLHRLQQTLKHYDIETIHTLDELRRVEPELRDFINNGAIGNNFFNDPAHIGLRLEVEPNLRPLVFVLRHDRRIRCIAAFFYHATRLRINLSVVSLASLPVRMLKVFGGEFILAVDEDPRRCFAFVLAAIGKYKSTFAVIFLENLKANTCLWEFCHSDACAKSGYRLFLAASEIDVVHQIELHLSHEGYLARLSAKTRQNLRSQARKLCSQHSARLERITRPDQVPAFLEQLDQVYRHCWQADVNGYPARQTTAQIRYLTAIAEQGWLRSYLLKTAEGPIAYELGFQYGDTFYAHEIGYSRKWSDLGPGSTLMHMFIEDLHCFRPPKLLDFGVGDAPYKRSFSNRRVAATYIYLVPRNCWRGILEFQKAAFAVERSVRRTLVWLRIDHSVRKLLSRKPKHRAASN